MPGAPLVLLPLAGGECIALEPDQFAQARERAREVLGPVWGTDRGAGAATQGPERLLMASEISEATGVPGPWFLEQARQGQIPHVKFGKYVRFRLGEVVAHGTVTAVRPDVG